MVDFHIHMSVLSQSSHLMVNHFHLFMEVMELFVASVHTPLFFTNLQLHGWNWVKEALRVLLSYTIVLSLVINSIVVSVSKCKQQ